MIVHVVNGRDCLFDEEDFIRYRPYGFHVIYGRNNHPALQFRRFNLSGKYVARILLAAPDALFVDHKDGNSLNNCRSNLRLATNSQNQANSVRAGTSGVKGVYKNGTGWAAVIQVNGVRKYLGTWPSKLFAELQYKQAAEKYFGEFASHVCR